MEEKDWLVIVGDFSCNLSKTKLRIFRNNIKSIFRFMDYQSAKDCYDNHKVTEQVYLMRVSKQLEVEFE